jgi:predicted kinase
VHLSIKVSFFASLSFEQPGYPGELLEMRLRWGGFVLFEANNELSRHDEVSVDSLAKDLNVSCATIRRDLSKLERQGLLRADLGGRQSGHRMLYEHFPKPFHFRNSNRNAPLRKGVFAY